MLVEEVMVDLAAAVEEILEGDVEEGEMEEEVEVGETEEVADQSKGLFMSTSMKSVIFFFLYFWLFN